MKQRIQFDFPQFRIDELRDEVGSKGLSSWLDGQFLKLMGISDPPETFSREFLTKATLLAVSHPEETRKMFGSEMVEKLALGVNKVQWMTQLPVNELAQEKGVNPKDIGAMLLQLKIGE